MVMIRKMMAMMSKCFCGSDKAKKSRHALFP